MKEIYVIYTTLIKELNMTLKEIDKLPMSEAQNLYDCICQMKKC